MDNKIQTYKQVIKVLILRPINKLLRKQAIILQRVVVYNAGLSMVSYASSRKRSRETIYMNVYYISEKNNCPLRVLVHRHEDVRMGVEGKDTIISALMGHGTLLIIIFGNLASVTS